MKQNLKIHGSKFQSYTLRITKDLIAILLVAFLASSLLLLVFKATNENPKFLWILGSFLCHQLQERSLFVSGLQLFVCSRCSGAYISISIMMVFASTLDIIASRIFRTFCLLIVLKSKYIFLLGFLTVLEWIIFYFIFPGCLESLGLRNISRFSTGFISGTAYGSFVILIVLLATRFFNKRIFFYLTRTFLVFLTSFIFISFASSCINCSELCISIYEIASVSIFTGYLAALLSVLLGIRLITKIYSVPKYGVIITFLLLSYIYLGGSTGLIFLLLVVGYMLSRKIQY